MRRCGRCGGARCATARSGAKRPVYGTGQACPPQRQYGETRRRGEVNALKVHAIKRLRALRTARPLLLTRHALRECRATRSVVYVSLEELIGFSSAGDAAFS